MYCDDWGQLMQSADMRLRIIFTKSWCIYNWLEYFWRFVPLFYQKIQYSLEISKSSSALSSLTCLNSSIPCEGRELLTPVSNLSSVVNPYVFVTTFLRFPLPLVAMISWYISHSVEEKTGSHRNLFQNRRILSDTLCNEKGSGMHGISSEKTRRRKL